MTPEQDRALKRRSRELGVSEAELRPARSRRRARRDLGAPQHPRAPFDELLANTRRLAQGHRLDGPIDRDTLYERGGRG